jgi:hypothetical protein
MGLLEHLQNRRGGEKKTGREKLPRSGEDERAGPNHGLGPLVLFDNIGQGDAGAGALGTDVVFVHGLHGTRLGTWSKGNVCWPRDLLRYDLKDVRVIAWGYDASVANAFRPVIKESIFGHANTLLEELAQLRMGTVCSSFFFFFFFHHHGF